MRAAHPRVLEPPQVIDDPYPASDGKPMAETQVHVALLASLYTILFHHFQPRGIYIAANMFLYYEEGNPKARTAPDIMAIKGVDTFVKRRSFKTWVEKAKPCCTLELTSKKTRKEDLNQKKELYRRLRVREYFLFDPLDEYLPQQLMGYRLTNGDYEPMTPDAAGGLTSKELGLRFLPDGHDLLVFHGSGHKQLLDLASATKGLEDAEKRLEDAENSLDDAERRNQDAAKRIADLEAELVRLKASSKPRKS